MLPYAIVQRTCAVVIKKYACLACLLSTARMTNADKYRQVSIFGLLINWSYFLRKLKKFGLTREILLPFYRSAIESMLAFSVMCMVRRHQPVPQDQA